jgi:TonB family protein
MILGSILLMSLFGAAARQSATPSAPEPSACSQPSTDGAASEVCLGQQAVRFAGAVPKESIEWTRQLNAAAEHYRNAVRLTSKVAIKVLALNLLADCYDAQRLNDAGRMETVLRELIQLTPNDLVPMYRLARLQEDEGLIDLAEQTLLDARHQQPDAVEPCTMLVQFYARRVAALHQQASQTHQPADRGPGPGERDENGVYRVGGSILAPSRVNMGQYPPEMLATGIQGQVVAEILVDASGSVSDANVVRSESALLDEAALQAVRNWRFTPTRVDGQPVPVKMKVTVNFVPPSTPSPAPPSPPRR